MSDRLLWPRRFAKNVVANALVPFLRPSAPLIVGYHRVVDTFESEARRTMRGMLVSRAMLERHIDCIGRYREFVSLDEVAARTGDGRGFDKPVAVMTFDDGYRDMYENAFPVLQRLGIPAAVFVVTSVIGTSRPHAHDRLNWLIARALAGSANGPREIADIVRRAGAGQWEIEADRLRTADGMTRELLMLLPRAVLTRVIDELAAVLGEEPTPQGAMPMTWDMLAEMHRAGIVVGSHTRHHALLPNESAAVVEEEVVQSRQDLTAKLGGRIDHFAYPNGAFNQDVVDAVQRAGYRAAYASCGHQDASRPWLTIPRRLLWERSAVDTVGRFSAPMLRCQSQGLLTGRPECAWTSHT